MAYRRGGVFRSRFIAPLSQRSSVVLSKALITQITLDYDASVGDLVSAPLDNETVTLALTVAAATGQERLVIVGGLSGAPTGICDFDACTVDGQVASRVGTVSRATGTSNYVVVSGDSGLVATVNFGATAFTGTAPAGFSAWGSGTTLNPSDKKDANVVLSGGNLTVTSSTTNGWVRSTTVTTGKRYVEFTMTAGTNDVVGIADQSAITFPGSNSHSFGLFSNGYGSIAGLFPYWSTPYTAGNVVCMAVDLDAKLVWFRVGAGGDWNGGPAGNPATGVGGISVSAYVSSYETFVTAYRAPGTSNTSINVTLTVNNAASVYVTGAYCSCWKMSYAGNVKATTLTSVYDPTLSANTTASGAAAAGIYGYGTAAFSVGGATVWTGLTERYDNTASANIVFSTASENLSSASTPLVISANVTPDLVAPTTPTGITAGLAISFNPILTRSLPALAGGYAINGTAASTLVGRRITASAASYAMTGSPATLRLGWTVVAGSSSYVMTGVNAGLNPGAGATASLTFDAVDTDNSTVSFGNTYTFPLTVASALGKDRLVVLAGIATMTADYDACTIDGQAATRVGFLARGANDGTNVAGFITAYRASGTANTSIDVVATVGGGFDTSYSGYCACYKMSGVGAVFAVTNNTISDPPLATDTVTNGAVVGGFLGYADTTPSVVWTGLTEDFDSVSVFTSEVFSAAHADIATGETPRAISVDVTPDLQTAGNDSVCSICISFSPSGTAGNTLSTSVGTYHLTGTAGTVLRLARYVVVPAAAYTMTGSTATLRLSGVMSAGQGSYALTGFAAALIKSGIAKSVTAAAGSYTMTGTDASGRRGVRVTATTVGSYSMVGTTVATGKGLIAAAGSYAMTGSSVTLIKMVGPNISLSVTGGLLTASVGSVTATGNTGAGVSVTGNQVSVSLGNVSVAVAGGISIPVTGNSMTASVASVSVAILGGHSVDVLGNEMTASVGTAVATIPGRNDVTMEGMTASVGTVIVDRAGSINVMPIGSYMTMSMGDVTQLLSANVSVTGEAVTASVGTVTAGSVASIDVTSPTMTASVGTVSVTAKQVVSVNVTGNAMQAYVGTLDFAGGGTVTHPSTKKREGVMLQPSNWMGG